MRVLSQSRERSQTFAFGANCMRPQSLRASWWLRALSSTARFKVSHTSDLRLAVLSNRTVPGCIFDKSTDTPKALHIVAKRGLLAHLLRNFPTSNLKSICTQEVMELFSPAGLRVRKSSKKFVHQIWNSRTAMKPLPSKTVYQLHTEPERRHPESPHFA